MNVRLISDEDNERANEILQSIQPPPPDEPKPPKEAKPGRLQMIEAMAALATILGFRVQLFFAFLGSLSLSGYAVYRGDPSSIATALGFSVIVFIPVLWVAYRRG